MATELVVSCSERRLIPVSQIDWEILDGIRPGIDLACKLWRPRSLKHQRWYRALITVVAEGCGIPHQALHEALKIKAGLFHMNISGDIPMAILHSTSFEAMDQIEFQKYTEFALMTILNDYLPGIKSAELIRRANELSNLDYKEIRQIQLTKTEYHEEAQAAESH